MTITDLIDGFSVSGELTESDLRLLVDKGVKTLINVRPDNETPEQLLSDQWAKLCQQIGLAYMHIPVKPGQYSQQDITRFKAAIEGQHKKVHCFCRTGTRAAHLYALANKEQYSFGQLQTMLNSKGYDLTSLAEKYSWS